MAHLMTLTLTPDTGSAGRVVTVTQEGVNFRVRAHFALNGTTWDDHALEDSGTFVWTFIDASAAMAFALDRCGWETSADDLERAEKQLDDARS